METDQFIYKKETYNIIGAAMDVHRTLGMGFLESVYQEAMEVELAKRSIPFVSQKRIQIQYKDVLLNQYYVSDLFCYDKIIVELKAVSTILPEHEAQNQLYPCHWHKIGNAFEFWRRKSLFQTFS